MLKRVVAIKHVGRFRNSAGTPNPAFSRHTVIYAANGYGKSTFCAVMRSVQSADPAPVLGRKTLGSQEQPQIDLLFADFSRRLQNGIWSSSPAPKISVFDGAFVADNVHSGDVVDLSHKRNLYRVIVGQAGVGLAEDENTIAEQARAKQAEITSAERQVKAACPKGLQIEDFILLSASESDVDEKTAAQNKLITSLNQAEAVRLRASLQPLRDIAAIELELLLAKSIHDVAADAQVRLADHLARCGMEKTGEQWLAEGVRYIADDSCPFCGRDGLRVLPLVEAYKALFSDAYSELQLNIKEARQAVDAAFGDRARDQIRTVTDLRP